jgi:hypothetical protein
MYVREIIAYNWTDEAVFSRIAWALSTTVLSPLSSARHNNELPVFEHLGFPIFPMRAICSIHVVIVI